MGNTPLLLFFQQTKPFVEHRFNLHTPVRTLTAGHVRGDLQTDGSLTAGEACRNVRPAEADVGLHKDVGDGIERLNRAKAAQRKALEGSDEARHVYALAPASFKRRAAATCSTSGQSPSTATPTFC